MGAGARRPLAAPGDARACPARSLWAGKPPGGRRALRSAAAAAAAAGVGAHVRAGEEEARGEE